MSRHNTRGNSVTEDCVSQSTVQDMLANQEKMFKELLNMQDKSFRTCLQTFVDSVNKRMDGFMLQSTKDICDLKHSLQFTQHEVDDLKPKVTSQSAVVVEIQKDLREIKADMDAIKNPLDYIENQSRRNNLKFEGIPETAGENWSQTEDKIRDLITTKLQLQGREVEIERAHRIGKPNPNRNRPVVVKFLKFKERSDILANSKKLKNTEYYIKEDFSDRVQNIRNNLWPKVKEERAKGNIAYISFDRLVVKPRQENPRGQ